MPITELALRYVLNDPSVHTVIAGAQAVDQLRDNIDAVANGPLPADVVARIEAINSIEYRFVKSCLERQGLGTLLIDDRDIKRIKQKIDRPAVVPAVDAEPGTDPLEKIR